MKNIFKVFIMTAGLIVSFNVNSFALVDGAVWGGYVFNGELENSKDEPKGANYGAKAHYNTSLIPLIELGLGGYYQISKYKFDIMDDTLQRQSIGLDVNLILSLPIIHPYVRGTYAFWDKYEDDVERFKAYGVGAGLELTVFPFIRIFGEYMYENTEHYSSYLRTNTVNFGLKADI